MMEAKKAKIITVVAVIFLVIVVIVAWFCLKKSKVFFLIAGADSAAILAILIWVFVQYCRNNRRRLMQSNSISVSDGKELRLEYSFLRRIAGVPTKFRYKELVVATNNFQSIIGEGGSASVYKGKLDDDTLVAVKRISAEQHGEKEFKAEVAAIASVQHVNLVRLLGYCCMVGGPQFVVYEFIHNGSLDAWIFPHGGKYSGCLHGCLPWDLRYSVTVDVAKALAYLHHDCRSKILHLDVKPENILLDENFRAIVTDFGLSKLMGKDESRVIMSVHGTRGYLAPEWLLERGISEKSDIYSYGMVVLEIIGGRRNVRLMEDDEERYWSYFPRIVTEKERQGRLMEIVDERLIRNGGIDENEVRLLVHVALWCIQEDPKLRPSMAYVVEMLEGRVVVDQPPETEMIIVDLLSVNHDPTIDHIRVSNSPQSPSKVESEIPSTSNCSLSVSVLSGRS